MISLLNESIGDTEKEPVSESGVRLLIVWTVTFTIVGSSICMGVLKLCGVISWHWLWITAPIWGTYAVTTFICLASVVIWAIRGCKP